VEHMVDLKRGRGAQGGKKTRTVNPEVTDRGLLGKKSFAEGSKDGAGDKYSKNGASLRGGGEECRKERTGPGDRAQHTKSHSLLN